MSLSVSLHATPRATSIEIKVLDEKECPGVRTLKFAQDDPYGISNREITLFCDDEFLIRLRNDLNAHFAFDFAPQAEAG